MKTVLFDPDGSNVGAGEVLDLVVRVFPLDTPDHSRALMLNLRVHHLVHVGLILVEYRLAGGASARRPQIRLSLVNICGLAPKR